MDHHYELVFTCCKFARLLGLDFSRGEFHLTEAQTHSLYAKNRRGTLGEQLKQIVDDHKAMERKDVFIQALQVLLQACLYSAANCFSPHPMLIYNPYYPSHRIPDPKQADERFRKRLQYLLSHTAQVETKFQRTRVPFESSRKMVNELIEECDPIPWLVKWLLQHRGRTYIVTSLALIPYLMHVSKRLCLGTQEPYCVEDNYLVLWIKVRPKNDLTRGHHLLVSENGLGRVLASLFAFKQQQPECALL